MDEWQRAFALSSPAEKKPKLETPEIEDVYAMIPDGTPILITP